MKKSTLTLSILTVLLATSSVVHAAVPTAELKVKGKVAVPTCTVAAPNNGTYDFGKISSTVIKPAAEYAVTPLTQPWSVNCDAEAYLTFSVVDNRAASATATASTFFGLGNVNTTGKIGYYKATMSLPKVDGVAVKLFTGTTGTTSFTVADAVNITKGPNMGWASAASTMKSGKVFTTDITVSPYLTSSANMNGPITDTVSLDGLMTMSFAFGL